MNRNIVPFRPSIVWATLGLVLISVAPTKAAGGRDPIVPLHTEVDYGRGARVELWSADIESSAGEKQFVLWLCPEYWAGKRQLAGLDLVLNEAGVHQWEHNLLSPPGNWHGLQPNMFAANDLKQGAANSSFGAHRTMAIESRGIVVRVDVLEADTSPLSDKRSELDELRLAISVDNLPGTQ